MALADRRAEAEPRKGPVCGVCLLLTTLNKADKATLAAWLDDPAVFSSTISRALGLEGHHVKGQTVSRHRNGHQ